GRPVASILTLNFKSVLVYKYGCADARFNSFGGTPFLIWKAIEEAQRDGLHEVDLGRSDLDTPGLVTFKDRWGSRRSVISYLRCSASRSENLSTGWTMRTAKWFVPRIPDRCLIAA